LVYSPNFSDHLLHLQQVLEVLQSNQLYAKRSKCQFGVPEIAYLGHLISSQGVRTDLSKLASMDNWPTPHNIKSLRGFLGLIGYYRKFIQDYGSLAAPLMALLQKNAFSWTPAATEAFLRLKAAVTSPPVLRLPNFTQEFLIECDASGLGLGTMLMQENHPIAFFSQALKGRALLLSTYDKELLSLVSAVQKWCPYLLGRPFKVRTDQQALKYLLEQRVATVPQQRWIAKLMGYDFVIEYKKGTEIGLLMLYLGNLILLLLISPSPSFPSPPRLGWRTYKLLMLRTRRLSPLCSTSSRISLAQKVFPCNEGCCLRMVAFG
jgi:hypothetical protein